MFRAIPTQQRDVSGQRSNYQQLLSKELEILPKRLKVSRMSERLVDLVEKANQGEVIISREAVKSIAHNNLRAGQINSSDFRRIYYVANKCYYRTGSITYDADISVVGAERYSTYGASIFTAEKGVLIAYDPTVILGILQGFNISSVALAMLSVDDLQEIRSSRAFQSFKAFYRHFAIELQNLELTTKGISKDKLQRLKQEVERRFRGKYEEQKDKYQEEAQQYGMREDFYLAVLSGFIGFFISAAISFFMGLAQPILKATKLTPALAGFVVDRLTEKETAAY